MTAVIALKQVSKHFGKQVAVDLQEMSIEKGQIYGLIGPNGAGKSTIMKLICGLLAPTTGSITVAGQVMTEKNRAQILQHLGIFIEEPAYYDNLTGYENLRIVKELKRLTEHDVAEVLAIVHLTKHKDKQVKHYSLGMKQRLAIAMAIMGRPEMIILDEPTNGLDPQAREEIRQLIRTLPEKFQTTVMISSHALDEIEKMVTQIGIIGQGKMLYQGTVEAFKNQYRSKICLQTSDNQAVVDLLGLPPQQVEWRDKAILLPYMTDDAVSGLVKELVARDIAVYRLSDEVKSLEELFIDFTASEVL